MKFETHASSPLGLHMVMVTRLKLSSGIFSDFEFEETVSALRTLSPAYANRLFLRKIKLRLKDTLNVVWRTA
jgi:hypothetical protein